MIEKIKPYVTISTENGGLYRAVNTIEVANKVNEIIEEINRLSERSEEAQLPHH